MLPISSLDDRATPLLKARIQTLFRYLPKALAGEEEAVHQMRVTGRRLRVGLPLLAAKPHGRRVSRARRGIRKLVRTAGAGRDLDVSLGLFSEWAEGKELAPEARTLLRRLRSARTRSRHRLAEDLLDLHLSQLRRDLRELLAEGVVDVFTVLGRFRTARDEMGNALLAALAALGDRYDPAALHGLRRRVRRLRYVAELGAEMLRDAARDAPSTLKKLQEDLGAVHDAWVFSQWFARQRHADLLKNRPSLARAAAALQAEWVRTSRERHDRFLKEVPSRVLKQTLELMGHEPFAA